MIDCDDDYECPKDNSLTVAIVGGLFALAAAVAPEYFRLRRERERQEREDRAALEERIALLEAADDDDD